MKKHKDLVLKRKEKKSIVYDVFYSEDKDPKPVVIFSHGYKGFKDWGAWDLVAEAFANAGFFFLKFNFSHNGGTDKQPIDFPDLEAFANNNFTKELEDLNDVLDLLTAENPFTPQLDLKNISLIGHSRGGGIVLIKAEEDNRVNKVVTWAGVSDFRARFQENTPQFKHWKETGVLYVENGRTKQQMPHYFQFFEDFMANEQRFTIQRAVKKLNKPLLIVHGDKDSTVTIEEANSLLSWSNKGRLCIIKDGDHVFGAKHPWKEDSLPNDLEQAVTETLNFLK